MTARLFQPVTLGGITVSNRITVAPMCQYAAIDGVAQPWHTQQIGALAASGIGLIIMEATGIEAIGRISPACLGLWNDTQEAALKSLIDGIRTYSDAKIGIQLAHAGRKGGSDLPWNGGAPLPLDKGGWQNVAPSPIPFSEAWPTPTELSPDDIARLVAAWAESAVRADRAGFDVIEIHAAHGYLLHEFLSPISNHRTDAYGGDAAGRMRFPLEVARTVRAVWPKHKGLGIRITGSDWTEGGITPADAAALAVELRAIGLDFIDVTSGGNVATARIAVGPGYQVPFAEAVKKAVPDMVVMAVGMIVDPLHAEQILQEGKADVIALARAVLDEPRWAWRAAAALGVEDFHVHPRYARATPKTWPGYALKNAAAMARAAE